MDALQFHPTSGQFTVEGIHFRGNPRDFVEVRFDVERLEGQVAVRPLLQGTWEFTQIASVKPAVQVIEKDPKPYTPPSPEPFPANLPPLTIGEAAVRDGACTYIHRVKGQDAVIHVSDINGTGDNFSSRPGLGSSHTTFDVSSRLERSGTSRIQANFDLLAEKNDDHLDISLRNLPLREMDPYFFNSDGVRVDGVLQNGKATMVIRRGMLSGDLAVRYRDLVAHYSPTGDRGKAGAFFKETLQKVATTKTQGQQAPAVARFRVARTRDEDIIKFLLSGLKPAAQDILTGDQNPGRNDKTGKDDKRRRGNTARR